MTKKLSETPLVHPTARVENSTLGRWTEIAERSRVSESELGDYSYMMQDCAVWCATIRKFSNIAASVRINATKARRDLGWVPRHTSFIAEVDELYRDWLSGQQAPVV